MDRREEFLHCTAPEPAEFSALPDVIEYIDAFSADIASLSLAELAGALAHVKRAYREFPELDILRPRRDLCERLRLRAGKASALQSAPLLAGLAEFAPEAFVSSIARETDDGSDGSRLLRCVTSLPASGIEGMDGLIAILPGLLESGRRDVALAWLSLGLDGCDLDAEGETDRLGNILAQLLHDRCPGPESGALARMAQSAKRRLGPVQRDNAAGGTRERMLAMAARLAPATRPSRPPPRPASGWASGTMPFDHFLLQWPCEIELADDVGDEAFVAAAYRAILLRSPLAAEMAQWLRLLPGNAVSRAWVIDELLASAELRAIGRQVRVKWRGRIMIDPGAPETAKMPAVTWSTGRRRSEAE